MLTYLIVPVLVLEERGVLDSIPRSAELFRKQWGEELLGGFGFGLLNFLLLLPGLLASIALIRLDPVTGVVFGIVYALFLATIVSA